MMRRSVILSALAAGLSGTALYWFLTRPPSAQSVRDRLSVPLPAPTGPLSVYFLGHSLVNRDMPAMLAQLSPPGHRYNSQLGWGATLKAHWGDEPLNGAETENAHPLYRPMDEALASGEYDALVLTEMVELRDALKYFDTPYYLSLIAQKALAARPDIRIYLYETWHRLDDPEGWLDRIDRDLDRYWLSRALGPALKDLPDTAQVHLIPAGQVLAAFVRAVEARGGVGNVGDRTDLFGRDDPIHLNDLGNYLVALVHFVVLYQQSPIGKPFRLTKPDGTPALAPMPETAALMQEVTARVIAELGLSGLSA